MAIKRMNTGKRRLPFVTAGMKNIFKALPLFLAVAVFSPDNAHAHKVTVFAWAEGGTVHAQSKFSGGRKVKGGRIIVTDLEGRRLLEGKTDDRGEFSFKAPRKTALRIVLEAGTGHRAEWTVSAEELGGASDEKMPASEKKPEKPEFEEQTDRSAASHLPVSGNMGADEIRKIVEAAVDKKMKPVLRMLAESRRHQGPTMTDIFGGIGYILGLMGLASYVHHRRKKD